jgi:hypothetical protein
MIEWQPIETAPRDSLVLLGTESDPYVDTHMFFVGLGWSYKDGFWSAEKKDIIFPSHWAPINSPIASATPVFYERGEYTFAAVGGAPPHRSPVLDYLKE